ncbi:MAG: hypothetical protein QF577_01095 [Phycisphaerae bacterium]|jgi:hypothetical protein|nr:hypothetical protein [Phycisphaerae bacterium]
MMKMDELRSLFPIAREKIYLFNGNIIPCATPVRRAMEVDPFEIDLWVYSSAPNAPEV